MWKPIPLRHENVQATGLPQWLQNRAPGAMAAPHAVQVLPWSSVPHWLQNRACGGFGHRGKTRLARQSPKSSAESASTGAEVMQAD